MLLKTKKIVLSLFIALSSVFIPFDVWSVNSRIDFMTYEIMRQNIDPELALNMLDSIFSCYGAELSDKDEVALLRRQVELAMAIGSYKKASVALSSLKGREGNISFEDKLRMALDAGICNYYSGEYASAIASALGVLAERKQESLNDIDFEAYILLSNVSNRIEATDESLMYLDKAQEIANRIESDSLRKVADYRVLLGRSSRSLVMNDYSSAYKYLLKSDSLRVEGVAPFCLETNLAIVFSFEHADDMAERYYKSILNSNSVHYNKSVALNNYAHFLISHKRIDEALAVMDMNLPQLKAVDATHALGIRQFMRFKALASKGDLEGSIASADSALNIMMNLMAQESKKTYSQVYGKFETDRISNELDGMKNQNSRLNLTIGIMSFLMICSAIWIFLVVRKKKELVHKLEAGRSELAGIHRGYLDRIDQMREELDRKNRELTKIELKNSQMSAQLDNIANSPLLKEKDNAGLVEGIRNEIGNISRYGSDWNELEKYFGQVHPGFYEILSQRHPGLTVGERRMCAFIKIGMKTSEIATLCNRSARTVESMKYRVKKKLGLDADSSLDSYIYGLNGSSNPTSTDISAGG